MVPNQDSGATVNLPAKTKKKKKKSKSSKTPPFPETTIKTLIFCRDVPLYSFNFYKMWSYCTFSEYFLKNKQ